MKEGKKFIIAGGGTGGHIFPAIAIANAIKKLSPSSTFLFVGAKGKMEMEKIPLAGFEIKGLSITGFNRSSLIKNIGLPFKIAKSFFQAASITAKYKPDAVIGVGGYSTFPMLRYAQFKGIPTFIHEANSYAGKSNIMLAKKAALVFTATDKMESFFPKSKIRITGNPVRAEIINWGLEKKEAIEFFGLNASKKVVLVIGGSLGARSINESISNSLELFEQNNLQLIWQTGKIYFEQAAQKSKGKQNVFVTDFINKMNYAYTAADIVISRSGAMSISELCIVKKPVVFVPFPFAAEDHQKVNAQKLVDQNAAIMVEDKKAIKELVPKVIALSKEVAMQKKMVDNIEKLSVKNADIVIAQQILDYLN